MSTLVTSSLSNGVFHLELCRPEKKNALTADMYQALTAALLAAEADPAVRVLLLSGRGGVFTAGNDLSDFLKQPPSDPNAPVFRFMECLSKLEKPLVAAVQGVAVGIGVTLLLHCDLVYADPQTRFILPFVNLGLSPEAASSLLLAQRVGHARAAEWLLLGQPFTAQAALESGLVNAIIADDQVLAQAVKACAALASQPPAAVRDTKRLMRQSQRALVEQTLGEEGALFRRRLQSPEAREAFAAFAEKRRPDFSRFN